ncbi:MAG: MYXO-CTERM sorting domain-containing protein [Sandaracinaceae bacterium]
MTVRRLAVALVLTLLADPAVSFADTASWCDGSASLATADATIGASEYPGMSSGVGSGFGGVLGAGVDMYVDSDGAGNLAWAFSAAGGCTALTDAIVIYIDSVPGVGITNTSQLTDVGDPGRRAVSGTNGTDSSDLAFASGFGADYAIVIEDASASLFELVAGGPLAFAGSLTRAPSSGFGASCVKELNGISMADLGSQAGNPIRWVATLINPSTAFRSNEFQGIATATAPAANIGAAAHALAAGDWSSFVSNPPDEAGFRGDYYYTSFDGFGGTGIAAAPTCAQLSSESWAITGFNDGDVAFGGTNTTTPGDYTRGSSPGGVGAGGLFAFRTSVNDPSLGIQPGGDDASPGTFTLRVLNASTNAIVAVDVRSTIFVFNDQGRSQSFAADWSTDGVAFTPLPGFTMTTPLAADTPAAWVGTAATGSASGFSIAPGAYFYLRFTTDDAGGSGSRDELAIGDVLLVPTYSACGDGSLDLGESCDDGALNGTTTCGCQTDCTYTIATTGCSAGTAGPCDAMDECDGAGACTPMFLTGTVCRPATAGPCDVAETCPGGTAACPPDGFAAADTVCLASSGEPCDADDVCNGVDATCPSAVAATGTSCRASTGACDLGASCDGVATTCPASAPAPAATACRPSSGACDLGASCDGVALACPASTPAPSTTVCRPDVGTGCDVADNCNGVSLTCPADAVRAVGVICNPASGACDVADVCDGSTSACAPAFATAGTSCRASTGTCDLGATCSGSSATCPASAPAAAGIECRGSAGVCDPAELCDGASIACPSDALLSGITCRSSTGACDAAELCDGTDPACPADSSAPDGTACADGTACNGAETCMAGACTTGAAVDCDDGDVCTADMCAEPAGTCDHAAVTGCCNLDSECDDGDPSTVDTCVSNACVNAMMDGGTVDGGTVDGGTVDGGTVDGGTVDGGTVDGGTVDGGAVDDGGMTGTDAGRIDAGAPADDAGMRDGGTRDAASIDAGDGMTDGGCSCRAAAPRRTPSAWLLVGLGLALAVRRRRR